MVLVYEVVQIDPLVRNLPSIESKIRDCGLPLKCNVNLTADRNYVVLAMPKLQGVMKAKSKVEACLRFVVERQSRGPFGQFDLHKVTELLQPGKFEAKADMSEKNFFKQLITKYNLIGQGTCNADIQFVEKYRQKKTLSSLTAICRNCGPGGFRCSLSFGKTGISISQGQIQSVSAYTNYLKKNKGIYKVTELSARWSKMIPAEKDMYQTTEKNNTQHSLIHNCKDKVVVPRKRRRAHSGIVNMAKDALKYTVADAEEDSSKQILKTGALHNMLEKDRGLRISKSTVTSLREGLLKEEEHKRQKILHVGELHH